MPRRARLSPRSGTRGRKDGAERAVRPSAHRLPLARMQPNPPNPGQMTRFEGQTGLRRPADPAVEAVRSPSPYLHPSGKSGPGRPRHTPGNSPALDQEPLQPLDFNPVNPTLQRRRGPRLTKGDRNPPESVIAIVGTGDRKSSEPVIGIVGMRIILRSLEFGPRRDQLEGAELPPWLILHYPSPAGSHAERRA